VVAIILTLDGLPTYVHVISNLRILLAMSLDIYSSVSFKKETQLAPFEPNRNVLFVIVQKTVLHA
jgi:hypothetical protein